MTPRRCVNLRGVWHCKRYRYLVPYYISSLLKADMLFYLTIRWGNTPAMDVLNLGLNENDAKRDYSLAFVGAYIGCRHDRAVH